MSQKKKEYIFDTAVRLFAKSSYDSVSIRDISAAAEINDATLYHYFKSKEGILKEILTGFENGFAKYIPAEEEIDSFVAAGSVEKLFYRFIPVFDKQEALFMTRAYRIICMEKYTYKPAKKIVLEKIYDNMIRMINYALNELTSENLIPPCDTAGMSALWADVMYSKGTLRMTGFNDGSTECLKMKDYKKSADLLIGIITGKMPQKR